MPNEELQNLISDTNELLDRQTNTRNSARMIKPKPLNKAILTNVKNTMKKESTL